MRTSLWLGARQGVTNVVSLFTTAVLARHLSPTAFGTVALAHVAMKFLLLLARAGVAEFVVVDRDEGRERRAHAAFWLNLCITAGIFGLCLLARPVIVHVYQSPIVGDILLVFIGGYVVDQLGVVPEALVKRTLRYEKLILRDGSLKLFASISGAVMAVLGFGVWSLVLPTVVVAPIRVIAVFWIAGWRPRFDFGVRDWPRIWKFSFHAILANVASTIVNDADNLVIGKFVNKAALGLYNIAWVIAGLVSSNTVGLVGSVVTPALAASATDLPRLRAAFARMLRAMGLVSFPAYVGMFVLAEDFVLTLYGEAYRGAILPLRILIVFAMRRSIGSPAQSIFSVLGRPEIGARLGLAFLPLFVLSILVGVQWGLVGVAVAVTASRTLWGMISFRFIYRLLEVDPWEGWRNLRHILASALAMGAVVALARHGLLAVATPPPAVILVSMTAVGLVTYLLLLRYAFTGVRDEVLSLTRDMSKKVDRVARRLLVG